MKHLPFAVVVPKGLGLGIAGVVIWLSNKFLPEAKV